MGFTRVTIHSMVSVGDETTNIAAPDKELSSNMKTETSRTVVLGQKGILILLLFFFCSSIESQNPKYLN